MKLQIKYWQFVILVLGLSFTFQANAQINPFPIQKTDSLMAVEARPALILLSTGWCQYCKIQKKQLNKNEDFKNKSSHFYYVEFDAESKESIVFNGQTHHNTTKSNRNSTHPLAFTLNGSDKIAFPTWVVLNDKYQVIFRYNGLLKPLEIQELLKAIEASR